jgi:hypothetical protein
MYDCWWEYWCIDDSCPENKNLVTNFDIELEPIYRKAIDAYGWDGLYIDTNAYWRDGTKDETLYALRLKNNERRDLSEFWEIFDEFYDEFPYVI